ncbi:MAG: PH domain-containing protein [Elusimicrobia bacterium]|nr:PH domain-containing protein [Elusimicrobiota bacterium]
MRQKMAEKIRSILSLWSWKHQIPLEKIILKFKPSIVVWLLDYVMAITGWFICRFTASSVSPWIAKQIAVLFKGTRPEWYQTNLTHILYAAGWIFILIAVIYNLRMLTTIYYLTSDELVIFTGLIHRFVIHIPLKQIRTVVCRSSLLGRILLYGTILVDVDGSVGLIFLDNVSLPHRKLKNILIAAKLVKDIK